VLILYKYSKVMLQVIGRVLSVNDDVDGLLILSGGWPNSPVGASICYAGQINKFSVAMHLKTCWHIL
jgi:hypothetical protein